MKFRPASPHLAERFHGPLRFGRRWRGHELPLRLVQLLLLVVLGGICAKLIAEGVSLVVRALTGLPG